jgi:hypothetical protein
VEDILGLVKRKGEVFDFIHVANAMNKIVRASRRGTGERSLKLKGDRLSRDPRFAQLIDLALFHCKSFRAQEGANVLHALGVFHADLGAMAVDEKLAPQLGEMVERVASKMKPQEVANTLNALCKMDAAAAAVLRSGWAGLARAAERTASEMDPQEVAITLHAFGRLDVAAAAVSELGWEGLADAVERTAREMNPQGVAMTLRAMAVLPAVADELSSVARKHLEAAAEREAPNMTADGRRMSLRGCEKLNLRTPRMDNDLLQ